MAEVIEDLRTHARLCRNFDFQFKGELDGQSYRPVQCGAKVRVPNDFATPRPQFGYVRGPTLVIYGFVDVESRDSWVEAVQAPLGGRVIGGTWAVDVMGPSAYRKVLSAVPEDGAIAPGGARSFGQNLIEELTNRGRPQISLSEAVEVARDGEELVQAELVLYSDETTEDVQAIPSWHIVLRRCVPAYGGLHAEYRCEGLQTHVIVDAETGELITKFVV